METLLVVNKSASESRVESEFQKALEIAKKETSNGFDNFTMTIKGDYSEAHKVCDRLEKYGVRVCHRGFDHRGDGSDAYAVVKFYVTTSK
jgi:hypothetical protein